MNFLSTLKRPLLALGAVAGLGLTAACGSDSKAILLAVEPGDYEGVGAFVIDDFDDEERGFLYVQITVNDDGTVEGSAKVYQPAYYEDDSVPDEDEEIDVTGTVTEDGITLDFDDVTAEGSISGDVLSATLSGETDEGEIDGVLALTPSWDSETGIACGYFNTDNGELIMDVDGFFAVLAGEDGDLLGAFVGNPAESSAVLHATLEGTFATGCLGETCSGGIDGAVTGDIDGDDIEYDLDADVDFSPAEGDGLTFVDIDEGGLSNDGFEGYLEADSYYCTSGEYD